MIEKMKFLVFTGPKTDIDRVVNTYLSRYEIHLENALSELTTVENLSPFLEINPYREALNTINGFYEELEDPEKISPDRLKLEEALSIVRRVKEETRSWPIQGLAWKKSLSMLRNPCGLSALSETSIMIFLLF